jgi:hypothetical protein
LQWDSSTPVAHYSTFVRTYIITFDFLGSKHPSTTKHLVQYFKEEVLDKKNAPSTSNISSIAAEVTILFSKQENLFTFPHIAGADTAQLVWLRYLHTAIRKDSTRTLTQLL